MKIKDMKNNTYSSLAAACREYNVSYDAVYSYARYYNISLQQAFSVFENGDAGKPQAKAWSDSEMDILHNLAGKQTADEIASVLNRSTKAVWKKACVMGLSLKCTNTNSMSAEDIEFVISNYGKMSQAQMAKMLGVHVATVRYHLLKAGLVQDNSKAAKAVRANCNKPVPAIAEIASTTEVVIRGKTATENISLSNIRRQWTKAEEDFLRENYPGMSYGQLSKILGRAKNTVRTHLKVMGLYVPQQ